MSEIKLTNNNFEEEVLNSKIPVIVDFFATWCGPCQELAPIIEEIAEENVGKIKVCKVNVDEEKELASQFRIMSIPTIIVFNEGKVINTAFGFREKDEILSLVNKKK